MPIMRHDFNKGKFFNIFKKNRIIKEIVDYCCNEKVVTKLIHTPPTTSGVQTPSKF